MSIITLKNVRLSFPQIWTAKAFNEGQDAKFNANFLLDKDGDKDQIESLRKEIKQAATAKFNGDIPKNIKMFLGDVGRRGRPAIFRLLCKRRNLNMDHG